MIRLNFPRNSRADDRLKNSLKTRGLIAVGHRLATNVSPALALIGLVSTCSLALLAPSANCAEPAPPSSRNEKKAASGQAQLTLKGVSAQNAVLNPNKYFGKAKAGYAAARECPEICAKLFCYCGCDLTDEHLSLLDCFTSDHGVDCYICQEEALVALKLKKQNKSLAEIQKAIDLAYRKEYPFDGKSPAYKKYDATKLWKDTAKASLGKTGIQDSASSVKDKKSASNDDAKQQSSRKPTEVNRKRTKGSCCGANSKSK